MRIPQSELGRPDEQYTKLVQGITAIVQVYHEPCTCVNIIAEKNGRIERQCYPISMTMYMHYCSEAREINSPSYEKYQALAQQWQKRANECTDEYIRAFYNAVASGYAKRMSSSCMSC